MHVTPVASATPNGRVRIHPSFNPSNRQLRRVAYAERLARLEPIFRQEDAELDRWMDFRSSVAVDDGSMLPEELEPSRIGHRRSVIVAGGENRLYAYSIGDAVREERSRSHKLKKSRLRLVRRAGR